jgi:hypothetical protein
LVTRNRRVTLARALEHLKRLLDVTSGGAFPEVLVGSQRRNLLSNGPLMSWFIATPSAFATFLASSINDG